MYLLPIRILLLIAMSLLFSVKTDCPLSYYPPRTTAGFLHAEIDSPSTNPSGVQTYEHPLAHEVSQSNRPKVSLGVSGLGLYKNNQQLGFNIDAVIPEGKLTSIVFNINTIGNGSQWEYIHFNFIASQADELLLGLRGADLMSSSNRPQTYNVAHTLTLPTPSINYRAVPKIFISGFQIQQQNLLNSQNTAKFDGSLLKSQGFSEEQIVKSIAYLTLQNMPLVQLSTPSFQRNGLLTFQVSVNRLILQSLSFSYMIYLEKLGVQNIYTSVLGTFKASGISNFFYDNVQTGVSKILGLTGIRYSADQRRISLQINDEQHQSQTYFRSISSGSTEFDLGYFGVEAIPGSVCKSCPGSPLIFSQFCVKECPGGYVSSINSDGAWICHQCNIEGFLIAGDTKRSCICAIGNYLVAPTQKCEACPYHCLTCNGNICLTCDTITKTTYRTLNSITRKCECPSIGYFDDSQRMLRSCIACNIRCRTCTGPKANECLTCKNDRTLQAGICQCNSNFVENEQGECVCQSPRSLNSQRQCIITQNQCNTNEILSVSGNGTRICNCAPGYNRSPVSTKCLVSCQQTEQFNTENQQCECKAGSVRNSTNSLCIACASRLNQIYNSDTKSCECISGFQLNRAGQCASCPPKKIYNSGTDSCECIFNFYPNNFDGTCQKCNSESDHIKCTTFGQVAPLQL